MRSGASRAEATSLLVNGVLASASNTIRSGFLPVRDAAGEERVVAQDRADADEDGVDLVAPLVDEFPGGFRGNPSGLAGDGGDSAVGGHGPLGDDIGHSPEAQLEERRDHPPAVFFENAGCDGDSRGFEPRDGALLRRVARADDDAAEAGLDHGVAAGGRLLVEAGAGFESDVQCGAAWHVAATAALAMARISACGPPKRSWKPSPMSFSSRTMTAPTGGFGSTRPRPFAASSSARRIQRMSSSVRFAFRTRSARWIACSDFALRISAHLARSALQRAAPPPV